MIKRWKEYSYILCLGISAVIIVGLYYTDLFPPFFLRGTKEDKFLEQDITLMEIQEQENIMENLRILKESLIQELFATKAEEESQKEDLEMGIEKEGRQEASETVIKEEEQKEALEVGTKEESYQGTSKIVMEEEEPKEASPVIFTSDSSYFNDALFIGDSRTEGLREYGDLGQATVLADSGMSIYRLWKESFSVDNQKQTLEQILAEKSYGKVYLMLGINELGYDIDQTIKKYRETLTRIEEAQPEAFIFLMANLHVTDEKAKNSEIYNNSNIDRMNQKLEELAEERGYIYLDVNPVFDDENGNLSKEYTVDQAHILGVYYGDWVGWILEHCIR